MTALIVLGFINIVFSAFTIALFVQVILSYFPKAQARIPLNGGAFLIGVTEPVLGPIRRALPTLGGFDLSPLLVFLLLQPVQSLLVQILAPVLTHLP